jgi:hypothetical protein
METQRREFLGIIFQCCQVYGRVHRLQGQDIYEGRCPRCMRRVSVRIVPQSIQRGALSCVRYGVYN